MNDFKTNTTKTVIARSQDGLETETLVFEFAVPDSNFDIQKAVKNAAAEFCQTYDGNDILIDNNGCFNWADFDMHVPNEICMKHGFSKVTSTYGNVDVNLDETLVDISD